MKLNTYTVGRMCVQYMQLLEVRITQDTNAADAICQEKHVATLIPCHLIHLHYNKIEFIRLCKRTMFPWHFLTYIITKENLLDYKNNVSMAFHSTTEVPYM